MENTPIITRFDLPDTRNGSHMISATPSSLSRPTKKARTIVVMLAVLEGIDLSDDQLQAGATGYVLRSEDPQTLLVALRELSNGNALPPATIAKKVTLHMRPRQSESVTFGLSQRELDVLRALVEGLSYKMIAHKLGITFETVRSHIKRIYSKMSVNNNTEAVAKAIHGFVLA
ncbi:MAG: response regulator transcription factor [Flavobacteriales bacterium]|nr:response regulator transcription factor [Flavobacteriales bacterium]